MSWTWREVLRLTTATSCSVFNQHWFHTNKKLGSFIHRSHQCQLLKYRYILGCILHYHTGTIRNTFRDKVKAKLIQSNKLANAKSEPNTAPGHSLWWDILVTVTIISPMCLNSAWLRVAFQKSASPIKSKMLKRHQDAKIYCVPHSSLKAQSNICFLWIMFFVAISTEKIPLTVCLRDTQARNEDNRGHQDRKEGTPIKSCLSF